MACYYRCVKKVGTQRGVTTQGLQLLHAPSASFCNPLPGSRRRRHPEASRMGGVVPPRQGAGSRSAGRGAGAAGEARPVPRAQPAPHPLGHPHRALTRPAGRPGRRLWSSRRGADSVPPPDASCGPGAAAGTRARCCAAEPRTRLLGRGAPGAGKAAGPGQAMGCPPAQWSHSRHPHADCAPTLGSDR